MITISDYHVLLMTSTTETCEIFLFRHLRFYTIGIGPINFRPASLGPFSPFLSCLVLLLFNFLILRPRINVNWSWIINILIDVYRRASACAFRNLVIDRKHFSKKILAEEYRAWGDKWADKMT